MEKPRFVVPLADLEYGPKQVDWELPAAWLAGALEGTEAEPRGLSGRLAAELTKDGRYVVVRGRVTAELTMPCARTLEPVDVNVDGELVLLLSPAASPDTGRRRRRDRGPRRRSDPRRKDDDETLTEEDAAEDTYEGDEIALDSFVREAVLLELPMFPLRSEDSAAIAPVPSPGAAEGSEPPLDPRLAPLAELKRRLGQNKE